MPRWFAPVLISVACLGVARGRPEVATDLEPTFRLACWQGTLDEVKALLALGAPLEEGDSRGRRPLILAVHNSPEIVKFLLAHGAQVDGTSKNGSTAFTYACERGVMEDVQMLFDAHADINHVTNSGCTALMLAAENGHDDAVSFLIDRHVDVNFGDRKSPAIFWALGGDHAGTVRLLLAHGARLALSPALKANPAMVSQPALNLAARTGDVDLVDFLLAQGLGLGEADRLGTTPLLAACCQGRNDVMVAHLLDQGAKANECDQDGVSALMDASAAGDVESIRLLVLHGANLEARDREGRTALIWAAQYNSFRAVDELIRQKADVNAADEHGETAVTYAGDRGRSQIVALLGAVGARLDGLHIIAKAGVNPPLPPARLWALAVGAIYAQWNGRSHEQLCDPRDQDGDLRMFREQWNIHNRAELLAELHDLEEGPSARGIGVAEAKAVWDAPGFFWKMERLLDLAYLDLRWRGRMNAAWNLCREANLIRCGVNVGFLQEDEAWATLLHVARRVQASFSSWREMDDNFLEGREIWAEQSDPDLLLCSQLLLNAKDPNSPWTRLRWDLGLGGGD